MRHGVMYFSWNAQLGSSMPGLSEQQVEGETDEDLLLQVEKVLERYYIQCFKNKPEEVLFAICEDGEPVGMEKLGNKYNVKVSITMMLEPKKERKAWKQK